MSLQIEAGTEAQVARGWQGIAGLGRAAMLQTTSGSQLASIAQVVADFRALQAWVMRIRQGSHPAPHAVEDLIHFKEAIDQLVARIERIARTCELHSLDAECRVGGARIRQEASHTD